MHSLDDLLHPISPAAFRADDILTSDVMTLHAPITHAGAALGEALAVHWMIAERRFAVEDMVAEFDSLSEAQVRAALGEAEQAGAVQRV